MLDSLELQAHFLNDSAPIVDKYKERLDLVDEIMKEKSDRMQLNDFDKATLAIMLDNVDKVLTTYARRKNLSDRTYSEVVGPFKKHAYNIITAMYTSFDLRDLISWQPLTQKLGAIYRMVYKFANTKGNISAGDVMFASNEQGKMTGYYSGQVIKEETITFTFDATDSSAGLDYYPLQIPEKINIVITGGAAAGTYTYLSTSSGVYLLQKDGGLSDVGEIDIATGVITLDSVDASGATSVLATYAWNSEKYSNDVLIPKITFGIEEKIVKAERSQLLLDTMLDVSYDYEAQFGGTLNAEMEKTVVQFLNNELAFRILEEMYDGATGNAVSPAATYEFDKYPATGTTKRDQAQFLYELLATMSTKIRTNMGRGFGNKLICGTGLLEFLKVLDTSDFVRSGVPKGNGPYYAGKLNGDYDVYFNPAQTADTFMLTYKGDGWWEAPYYLGVYLPLMKSDFWLFPDMHGEQGFFSMQAFEFENPNMVVKGTVTTSTP